MKTERNNRPADPLAIDPDRLDREWLEQSTRMRRATERHAAAQHAARQAKARLELVKSQLYVAIRINPTVYGLPPRPSQDLVKAAVIMRAKYRAAQDAVLETEYKADVIAGIVRSLEHRKTALGKLVDLALRDYHSEPFSRTADGRDYAATAGKRAARSPVRVKQRKPLTRRREVHGD